MRVNLICAAMMLAAVWTLASGQTFGAETPTKGSRIGDVEQELSAVKQALAELTGETSAAAFRAQITEMAARLDAIDRAIGAAGKEREAADKARDDTLAAQAASLKQLKDALDATTKRLEDLSRADAPAGYDNGIFVQTAGENRIRLQVNGFLRPYYALSVERQFDADESGQLIPKANRKHADRLVGENGFGFRSARLMLALTISDVFAAHMSLDYGEAPDAPVFSKRYDDPRVENLLGDRPLTPRLRVLDLYGVYSVNRYLSLKAGQLKVPFDKESQFLPTDNPFVTGSLVTRRYVLYGDLPLLDDTDPTYRRPFEVARGGRFGRDVGAEIETALLDERLEMRLGVFNGAGAGMENDNRDVLTAFRIEGRPLGPMSPGIIDESNLEKPLLALGAAVAFDLLQHQSAYDIDTRYNSADINLAVDVHAKWRGISLLSGLFFRYADHGGALFDVSEDTLTEAPVNSIGATVQLAYYHQKTRLLPAVRYAMYDARLDRKHDHVHQATVALGYGVLPNHLRLTLEYSGLFPSDTTKSYLAPLGAWVDDRHDLTLLAEVSF